MINVSILKQVLYERVSENLVIENLLENCKLGLENSCATHKPRFLILGLASRLICFQRLSVPNVATQQCSWWNNWYTRGLSVPVLSY